MVMKRLWLGYFVIDCLVFLLCFLFRKFLSVMLILIMWCNCLMKRMTTARKNSIFWTTTSC